MDKITLQFSGLDADENRLDLYDASISNYGLARTVSILAHFYQTGDIIVQAPRSEVKIYLYPPEEGSFKSNVAAAVVGGMITAPFGYFFNRVMDDWLPNPDPQMEQVIDLLQEQNSLLRIQQGLPEDKTVQEVEHEHEAEEFVQENANNLQVIRSITANSFKDTFRPVGRSASYVGITVGDTSAPVSAIDPEAVALIQSERRDPDEEVIVGVVNSFSRSSKTGILFSRDLQRGIPFKDISVGRLPAGDDYSWSQYTREPIAINGTYVRWFDGRIKRFLVERSTRLPTQ